MTISNRLGISLQDLQNYQVNQIKYFSQKADRKLYKTNIAFNSYIQKISIVLFDKIPQNITLLSTHDLHATCSIEIDANQYIFMISKSPTQKELGYFREQSIHAALTLQHLQTFKFEIIDVSRKKIDCDFALGRAIIGKSLFAISKRRKLRKKELFTLGETVAKIHRIKTSRYGIFNVQNVIQNKTLLAIDTTWKTYFTKKLSEHINFCFKKKLINKKEAIWIEKTIKESIPKIIINQPVLLHGDIANHNVLVTRSGITLIDWKDALSGDPVFDIAYYGTGAIDHPEWMESFLKGYTSLSSLPNDFKLRYWLYFLRISLVKAVFRYREFSATSKSLPSVKKRISFAMKELSLITDSANRQS